MTQAETTLHATTVAVDGRGILICGPSGSGKSALALQLIALGADLVADDRTHIIKDGNLLVANVPDTIVGLIEARGVGLLRIAHAADVPLILAVDLSRREMERLPQHHSMTVLGVDLPSLHKIDSTHFPAAILLYLRGERISPS